MKYFYKKLIALGCISCIFLTGCGNRGDYEVDMTEYVVSHQSGIDVATGFSHYDAVVLTPETAGVKVCGADGLTIDYSNANQGYVMASYQGSGHIKVQITGDQITTTYTYDVPADGTMQVLPLTSGSGEYLIEGFQEIANSEYKTILSETVVVSLEDENLPFLYPNQYVSFDTDSAAVAKAAELAAQSSSQLEIIENIYTYCTENISYDYEKAETATSTYLPNVDATLEAQSGICFDYAALMTCMLRSQGIPAKLEIGYAGATYHAWVSVYTTESGTICDDIQFDGQSWRLLDPTTVAQVADDPSAKNFVLDMTNYTWLYSH